VPKLKITEKALAALPPAEEGEVTYWDETLPGFVAYGLVKGRHRRRQPARGRGGQAARARAIKAERAMKEALTYDRESLL
jgi:hypothetical protein